MQEHMNQFQETFIKMATEYTEHVRREMEAANKKANEVNTLRAGEAISFGPAPVTITDEVRTIILLAATVNRMRREHEDRSSVVGVHMEVSELETAPLEDMLRNGIAEIFREWGSGARDNNNTNYGTAISRQQEKGESENAASSLTYIDAAIMLEDDKEINRYLTAGWKIAHIFRGDGQMILVRTAGT